MDYYIVNRNENEIMARKRLYYPASQIITNLYTSGKEYMTTDSVEYVGFYHKYIDGAVMTGAVYDKIESKVLKTYVDTITQPELVIYRDSIKKGSNSKTNVVYNVQPKFAYVTPTELDFQVGKFKRYFIKRRNFKRIDDIFEIDSDQFKLWRKIKSGIDETLYDAIEIDWKLTGPLNDITDNNVIVSPGVASTNERIVRLASGKFTGLDMYLTNYIEFSTYSPLCPQEFKQKFGYLTN